MNKSIFYFLLLIMSVGAMDAMAQKSSHIGEWKLVSQKVTLTDGRVFEADSTRVLQRKILTSLNQVIVIGERLVDGQKVASSVHGGHYTLTGNDYSEKLEYAAYKDYDKVKNSFTLTVEGDKMRMVGTLEGADGIKTIYDEVYVRQP